MKEFYTPKSAHEELGVAMYTPQHLRRLEKQGKIPPLYRPYPGGRIHLGPEHIAALIGRRTGSLAHVGEPAA